MQEANRITLPIPPTLTREYVCVTQREEKLKDTLPRTLTETTPTEQIVHTQALRYPATKGKTDPT